MTEETKGKETIEDLGFGSNLKSNKRFINKDGSLNVDREGYVDWTLYHHLTESNWGGFFFWVLMYYITINSLFALVYTLIGTDSLNGIEDGTLWENFSRCFFFSVQTFTTVGYGAISPTGMAANWVASLEALVGLLSAAVATGLLLTKFTRPEARILYSKEMLVTPFQNGQGLMFRIANARNNKIMNLQAILSATWLEEVNGQYIRRYASLKLERNKIFLFPLNWTVVHPLNKESPFYGKTNIELKEMNVEYLVMLEGYDESYSQNIYSNTSYTCDEVVWNARFKRMVRTKGEKGTVLELDKIDAYEIL